MSELSRIRRAASAVVAIGLLVGLLPGCSLHGLSYRLDNRIAITSPAARKTTTLPVTVSWSVKDFRIVGPGQGPVDGSRAGYFAVFADAYPPPPGKTLRYVARNDRTCRAADGCPDAAYLAARGIYTTTDTSLVLSQLQRPAVENGPEQHFVTIILLDPSGHRIGESAFRVEFAIKRKALL